MKIILSWRRHHYVAKVSILLITVALIAGMVGCGCTTTPSQNLEIRDWYDLDSVRDNLAGNHTLMDDLDSTTAGYTELASLTANQGKGWEPIKEFTGTFDGQGYEIRDLFINRPDEIFVGLFGLVDAGGVIENIGAVNVTVIGYVSVGGLVGENNGTVSNSYSSGDVTGGAESYDVGGLIGEQNGAVSGSYSTGNVTGDWSVGGLLGFNQGTVSNSYSSGSVTGDYHIGGLVGYHGFAGNVSNSYSSGSVTGYVSVGGLVGYHGFAGTVSGSYSTGSVTGNWSVGGLLGENGEDGTVSNSYSTGNVTGDWSVGGLVGKNEGTVSYSFWDTETSGAEVSAGGTGKNTTEMQDITTFSGAGWDIIEVANPGTRNPSYIWNIVNNVTYPFLSWEP